MSLEAMKSILAAEEQARSEKAIALQNAKKAIADAEKAAADCMDKAYARADEEIRALMKATEAKAAQNADDLLQSTANKCAAMRAKAETKLDEAALLIVRRVVEV